MQTKRTFRKVPKTPALTIEIIQEAKILLQDSVGYDIGSTPWQYSYFLCDCIGESVRNIYDNENYSHKVVDLFQQTYLDPSVSMFSQFPDKEQSQSQRFMLLCFIEEQLRDKKRKDRKNTTQDKTKTKKKDIPEGVAALNKALKNILEAGYTSHEWKYGFCHALSQTGFYFSDYTDSAFANSCFYDKLTKGFTVPCQFEFMRGIAQEYEKNCGVEYDYRVRGKTKGRVLMVEQMLKFINKEYGI